MTSWASAKSAKKGVGGYGATAALVGLPVKRMIREGGLVIPEGGWWLKGGRGTEGYMTWQVAVAPLRT
jgi:hypothetical protein